MSIEERVARLEVQSEQNREMLKDIDAKVTSLTEQFLKHRGFIGGVIFTISAMWAAIGLGIEFLWRRHSG